VNIALGGRWRVAGQFSSPLKCLKRLQRDFLRKAALENETVHTAVFTVLALYMQLRVLRYMFLRFAVVITAVDVPIFKKDRQCTYVITPRRVRVTIVTVEKQ
jgi:hypothetical protein